MTEARITFYSVRQCGFFAHGIKAPQFGHLADILSQLNKWSTGVSLSATKLINPTAMKDDLPVYMAQMIKRDNDWFFSCWNEFTGGEGANVTSISRDSKVGEKLEVHQNAIAENSIPGYPTYFWAIPAHNVVAAITFSGDAARQTAMANYIRRFMQIESSYVVLGQGGDNAPGHIDIAGYTDQLDDIPQNVKPRFKIEAYQKAGKIKHLLENHLRIKRVVSSTHLTIQKQEEKRLFKDIIRFLKGDAERDIPEASTHSIKVTMDYTPTKPELERMIQGFEDDDDVRQWEDLGFQLQGEDNPLWLSKSRASEVFDIQLNRDDGYVAIETLADAICARRGRILELLKDD